MDYCLGYGRVSDDRASSSGHSLKNYAIGVMGKIGMDDLAKVLLDLGRRPPKCDLLFRWDLALMVAKEISTGMRKLDTGIPPCH